MHFCHIENFAYGEIHERRNGALLTPTAGLFSPSGLTSNCKTSRNSKTWDSVLDFSIRLMKFDGSLGSSGSEMPVTFQSDTMIITRAGASTRFTSTSISTSTCNMCEYEYESEYLIITWVRVRVLVDEYEYKYEYCSIINILYSMYRQQIFIVRSYKPGTKLQLPIVQVNYLCQYISCLIILCNLIQWHFNLRFATYWLSWITLTTCCQLKKQKAKIVQYHEMCGK